MEQARTKGSLKTAKLSPPCPRPPKVRFKSFPLSENSIPLPCSSSSPKTSPIFGDKGALPLRHVNLRSNHFSIRKIQASPVSFFFPQKRIFVGSHIAFLRPEESCHLAADAMRKVAKKRRISSLPCVREGGTQSVTEGLLGKT